MATNSHAEKCVECSRMCQMRTLGTVKPKRMGGRRNGKGQRRKAGDRERIRAALCQAGKGMKLVHRKDLVSRMQLREDDAE